MMSAEELRQMAEESSDLHRLCQIAEHPAAPGDLLAALWNHPRVIAARKEVEANPHPGDYAGFYESDDHLLEKLETAIARHPNLPDEMLAQFALQPRFGAIVARHHKASPQLLESMLHNAPHHAATIREIGLNPNTPAAALDMIVCRVFPQELEMINTNANLSPLAREIIAFRQGGHNASPRAIAWMAAHGTVDVLNRIVQAAGTPASILHQIVDRSGDNFYFLELIASHPNVALPTVLAIADRLVRWYLDRTKPFLKPDTNPDLGNRTAALYAVLARYQITLDQLGDLQHLFRMSQREKLDRAADPESSGEMLALLAHDPSEHVLCALAKNPGTPITILETLIEYRSEHLEDAIAQNPNSSAELLREIFKRQHGRYALDRRYWLLAAHPNTPHDILTWLAGWRDSRIQNALNNNPGFQRP